MTWPEAITLAQKNNHELKSAQKQVEVSQWLYHRSQANFLPQVSASLSISDTISGEAKNYSYGLSATQYLFKGLASYYSLKSAEAEAHYYQANLKYTQSKVYYELRSAFINFLISQKNLELQEKILERRRENNRLISLRYQSGKEDKGNLMSTQADQAAAEYNLTSAEKDLRLNKNKMLELLGQSIEEVEGNIEIKNLVRPDFEVLLRSSPAYEMARYQLESGEINQQSTVSEFLPSVSLSGSFRKTGSDWPPETGNKSWSLNISYPFFPGGANIADVNVNNLKLAKSREDFARTVKETRYNLEEAYENYQDSVAAMAVKKIYLEATAERSKIAQAKYINGLLSYDDWNRAESDYISAQVNLLATQKSVLVNEAAWYNSYGSWVK